jgi:CRP/FNR family transcriptional regulator
MSSQSELDRAIKESPYFQGLSPELLSALVQISVLKRLSKGEHLFFEGEKALGFYFIVDGMMKLYKLSPKGKESVIHIFGPGEIFAEVVLAGSEAYPVNAQALTDATLAFFPKANLLNLLKRNPDFGLNLIGLLCVRLKSLLKTIENLTLKEAGERLIAYLWELTEEGKKEELTLSIPKSQLALLLGITPETLSRILQRLKEEDIIAVKGKRVKIKDMAKLRSLLS